MAQDLCPIHGVALKKADVRIIYGYPIIDEAEREANKRFPFAKTPQYGGCEVDPNETFRTIKYCDDCTDARKEWLQKSGPAWNEAQRRRADEQAIKENEARTKAQLKLGSMLEFAKRNFPRAPKERLRDLSIEAENSPFNVHSLDNDGAHLIKAVCGRGRLTTALFFRSQWREAADILRAAYLNALHEETIKAQQNAQVHK